MKVSKQVKQACHKTGVTGMTFDLEAADPCNTVGLQQHLLLLF